MAKSCPSSPFNMVARCLLILGFLAGVHCSLVFSVYLFFCYHFLRVAKQFFVRLFQLPLLFIRILYSLRNLRLFFTRVIAYKCALLKSNTLLDRHCPLITNCQLPPRFSHQPTCIVCLDKLEANTIVRRIPCTHAFHA